MNRSLPGSLVLGRAHLARWAPLEGADVESCRRRSGPQLVRAPRRSSSEPPGVWGRLAVENCVMSIEGERALRRPAAIVDAFEIPSAGAMSSIADLRQAALSEQAGVCARIACLGLPAQWAAPRPGVMTTEGSRQRHSSSFHEVDLTAGITKRIVSVSD